jgi:hypothetical protein
MLSCFLATVVSEPCVLSAQADIARGKCGAVFQYDRPIVDQVSPDHGATAGGYVVSVTGDNFGTTPSSLSLLVGRTPCSRTGWVSNSMATCLVPQGVGATRVVVEVEGQRSGPGGAPRAAHPPAQYGVRDAACPISTG